MASNDLMIQQFEHDLVGQSHALESVLPPGLELRRFMRTVSNLLQTHAQSARLLAADRQSLFNACLKAAGDGLLLDGREAVLTVFHESKSNTDKVTYMPMVQGLVKLARNSSEISNIVSEVVYDKDEFIYRPGIDEHPLHQPDWFGERGKPIGAYAVVTTKDNEKIVTVLARDRILAIGQGGRNADQYMPGKGAHFVEWWKKTVIKNALKYSPKSTYLASAMAADNELISPDKIPPTEKNVTPIKTLKGILHGESVTARTESEPPSGRSTVDQYIEDQQENTPVEVINAAPVADQGEAMKQRVRHSMQDNHQSIEPSATEQDEKDCQLFLEVIANITDLKELKEFGEDIAGKVHPDFLDKVKGAYKQRRNALMNEQ
ncbi:RecT family recombinase [Endozoicomonas sp. ONNA2]|uniref:RecT family recombinase n=1 Tax=Endozoicomonas sp. ONNA2 TaxID=2828741 RepID=UPI0021474746|nr:RecT family recombinase [Endozoicomonas sp. ONNA2]